MTGMKNSLVGRVLFYTPIRRMWQSSKTGTCFKKNCCLFFFVSEDNIIDSLFCLLLILTKNANICCITPKFIGYHATGW
jgi:hypothetical protein